jgi:3-deoxy-manno-octulosonate cytidylyltransferase (CMP-KDO synthetase)
MVMKDQKAIAVIPARMGSSRFPGKPLAPILGMPMIEHVYHRTAMCRSLAEVYIATCDEEIYRGVERFGGRAIMTSPRHERASDRVAEAVSDLKADIVVMVQGDEPMTVPTMVEKAIAPMIKHREVHCVNLVKRILNEEEYTDPNTIKVVMDKQGHALYFSREPIPTKRILGVNNIAVFKQVCIIPFRHDLLMRYTRLEPTPLEKAESIDMLRLLEHGHTVHLVETECDTHSVDSPEDLRIVEEQMRHDPITYQYLKSNPGGVDQ